MNNDIVPRRPVQQAQPTPLPQSRSVNEPPTNLGQSSVSTAPLGSPELNTLPPIEHPEPPVVRGKSRKKQLVLLIAGVVVVAIVAAAATILYLLGPKDAGAKDSIAVEIVTGMVPNQIAETLEDSGVIRSRLAFLAYARLSGSQNSLQAGNYQLSPADSVAAIVSILQGGPASDEIEVMFKPGATLAASKQVLSSLGYSDSEITTAFSARYDHPLLVDRPAGADLEGYIFGETHRFTKGTSIETILKRYFDDYYAVITENNLIELYRQQGLDLHEAVTLASIIQRESGGDDKAQIAQVFLLRLAEGMQLGSDVTYQYIADKEGQPRDTNYDSPYNTRRYTGLPPGPIATPGVAALKAVGSPADGNYVFFLSGDDDITYFARTLAEHEANIRNHCQKKCSIL